MQTRAFVVDCGGTDYRPFHKRNDAFVYRDQRKEIDRHRQVSVYEINCKACSVIELKILGEDDVRKLSDL